MLLFEVQKSKNAQVVKKCRRMMLSSNCGACGNQKSRYIRGQGTAKYDW